MGKADTDKSYGGFERFIFIFLLPILFTVVLTGVLLTLFDYDVKNILRAVGEKTPLVNRWVPDDESGPAAVNPANERIRLEEEVSLLSAERDRLVAELEAELQSRDETITQLEESLEKLIVQEEAATVATEEYRIQLQELSAMYASMTPSRAASILQNLAMPELVLVLYEMKTEDRGKILQRMDPETAAEASIQLKDINEVNRSQWEEDARKAREALNGQTNPDGTPKLGNEELARTFAAMTAESAATILLELNETNNGKVIAILSAMDVAARSALIAEIGQLSPQDAASLANRLGN